MLFGGFGALELNVAALVRLAVISVAVGLTIALAASRVMRALLYDTSPYDPAVTCSVRMLLIAITAVASALPARRAARID